MTVQPTIRVPYSLSGLNFLFSGGLIENSYYASRAPDDESGTHHHEALQVQGDLNAQFLRNGMTDLFDLGNVESIIMPRIRYTFLKNTTSFADIPSLDPSDRIGDGNTITYSLNHYFNAVKDGQAREISLLEIEQTYGISGNLEPQPYLYDGSGHRFSDVRVRFTMFPHSTFWFVNEDVVNIYGNGLQTTRNTVHFALPPYIQADVSHSYTKDLVSEVWLNTLSKWRSFDLNYQIRYSLMNNAWVDSLASLTYHPSCWSVTVTLTKTRRPSDTSIHFSFNLQGITQKIGGI